MKNLLYYIAFLLFVINPRCAAASVSEIFSDNMIFQKGKNIVIWGEGKPEEIVEIIFNSESKRSTVDSSGNWKVSFDPMKYGGPYEMKIISEDTLRFKNIFIGEVWVCSGQSNMNMPLGGWGRVNNYKEEIASADFDSIHILTIPLNLKRSPASKVKTSGWKVCNPETIENFSAVAYFFGRELYRKLKVPIGLVSVSKGGTPIESWMNAETLSDMEEYKPVLDSVSKMTALDFDSINSNYKLNYLSWLDEIDKVDSGFTQQLQWYGNINTKNWKRMTIPTVWENAGLPDYDGVVWFKKKIIIPDNWEGKDLILSLGAIQDYDITFINGNKVGEQLRRNHQSVYIIDKSLIDTNEIEITVRILDNYGVGGIWDKPEEIFISNGEEKITLAGEWLYKPSVEFTNDNYPPENPNPHKLPTVLYNGMINPLTKFPVGGIIWYQGESNAREAYRYGELFSKMISDWRGEWDDPNLPFYFVQLAGYKEKKKTPEADAWAELREAQSSALKLENTGMATAIDIGDEVDVHPKNKQEVGRRLSLIALNKNYGKNIEYSGPVFRDYQIIEGKAIIEFSNNFGLHTSDGNTPAGFALAGKDSVFYWAEAEIEDEKIIVWSDSVAVPTAVRYCRQSNPDCNLYNDAGLPALPFRTDNYPLTTNSKYK